MMLGSHVDAPPLSPLSEVSQSPFGRSFAESSFGGTKDSKDSKTSEDEDGGDGYQFASQDSRMMLLGMLEKLVSIVDLLMNDLGFAWICRYAQCFISCFSPL